MQLINELFSKEEILGFVGQSESKIDVDFHLYKGEEEAGWVRLYFKYSASEFSVLISLAMQDLFNLVVFFENIINSKEEISVFFDDELISMPLLYACPIDEYKIRFLVADERSYNNSPDENDDIEDISRYEIRCDVITDKRKLLKEFCRVIKNILKNWEGYEENMYDINYDRWKNNFKNIVKYVMDDK